MKQAGTITFNQWNYFLRGSSGVERKLPEKPDIPWLSDQGWNTCCILEVQLSILSVWTKRYVNGDCIFNHVDVFVCRQIQPKGQVWIISCFTNITVDMKVGFNCQSEFVIGPPILLLNHERIVSFCNPGEVPYFTFWRLIS